MKIFLLALLLFISTAHAEGLRVDTQVFQQKELGSLKLDLSIGFIDRTTRLPFDERLYQNPRPWLDFGKPQKPIPVPELRFRLNESTTLKFRGKGFKFQMKFDVK